MKDERRRIHELEHKNTDLSGSGHTTGEKP
jgi:hypothetical protein